MKNSSVILRVAFCLITAPTVFGVTALPQTPPAARDFQLWNETTLSIPLAKKKGTDGKETDKISLLVLGTLRLGQNRLYPVDSRIGMGFDFRLKKGFSFTPTYIYRTSEEIRGREESEHRIRFDLTYEHRSTRFSLRDRSRLEFRFRNSRSEAARYRNRLSISIPVKRNDKEIIAPFGSVEGFYVFSNGTYERTEFTAGISQKLNSVATAEYFYVLRLNHTGTVRTINGVGVNMKFRLR